MSDTLIDDPSALSVQHRPFSRSPRHITATNWASSCLSRCEAQHTSCKATTPSFIPTRLLKIEKSPSMSDLFVRLYDTGTPSFQTTMRNVTYATLSYCWGGPQDVRLDLDHEAILFGGIPATNLPKTLFDAV